MTARRAIESEAMVRTLDGPLPATALGVVLPSEHLLVEGWDHRAPNYGNSLAMEVDKFTALGGRTIVDTCVAGDSVDRAFLRSIAARTGVQVIASAGLRAPGYLPTNLEDASVDQLIAFLEAQLGGGDGTAGVLVLGVGTRPLPARARAIEAVAAVKARTGLPLVLRLPVGSSMDAHEAILDAYARAGGHLNGIAVGNLVARPDVLPLARSLVGRGCMLLFDRFAHFTRPVDRDLVRTGVEVQISSLRGFIDQGMLDSMLISGGVEHVAHFTANRGEGFRQVLHDVVPGLQRYGVDAEAIRQLTTHNPQHWLLADRT